MKKTVKGGLALAILMAGSAQAALVKVDLTGTVNYGYQSDYDYNYNTGVNNSTYNDLTGTQAHVSFLFDTAKAPDQSYSYNDGSYSYAYNYFNSAVSSFTGSVGGTTVSGDNATAYTYNQNWYGSTYGGAGVYGNNYNSTDNSYDYENVGLSSWGDNPVDVQDFLTAFLSSANPISFYFDKYVSSWNNDSYAYNYTYAYGTFDNISVSPAAVPVPAAVWLFGSALMGLFGIRKRKGMMPMLTA
jgi:hypothetical protein